MNEIEDYPFSSQLEDYSSHAYEAQLTEKLLHLNTRLGDVICKEVLENKDIIQSPPCHYRQRCRFAIVPRSPEIVANGETDDRFCQSPTQSLSYALWKDGGPTLLIDSFPIASKAIYSIMQPLLIAIETSPELAKGIQAANFLSSTIGDVVVTLIYNEALCESSWNAAAENMISSLQDQHLEDVGVISIIGRSKGMKLLVGRGEFVFEKLSIFDEMSSNRNPLFTHPSTLLHNMDYPQSHRQHRTLTYKQITDGFSNPNSHVNAKALEWICDSCLVAMNNLPPSASRDLLELYCGGGNHTVALSCIASRIVAVELNSLLCDAARENLDRNNVTNVLVVACDSQKFAKKILKDKKYTPPAMASSQLSSAFEFNIVLCDPPRAGLDAVTIKLIKSYKFIIYISCGPAALERDLKILKDSHKVVRMGVFDQFAYTKHIETGVLLMQL